MRVWFAFLELVGQSTAVVQPLALVLYEKLLPGSQLVNRLQDLNYRVQTVTDPGLLVGCAEEAKPMLVLADLSSSKSNVCPALQQLKANPNTQHLPVIAFGADDSPEVQAAAKAAGVTLLVSDAAVLNHLPQVLQQAIQLD